MVLSRPPEIFDLQIWCIKPPEEGEKGQDISPACIVEMIFQPDTQSFHLLLNEEDMEELIEYWLAAREVDVRAGKSRVKGNS